MFLFLLLNLCMGFFLKDESYFKALFMSDFSLYTGGTFLLVSFITSCLSTKKISFTYRYDLFAVGSLLVWFSYWPPFFRFGSPMFEYYPLYFALITALSSLFFITKPENMDPDAVTFLQWLSDSGRFNPIIIMIGVIISLAMPEHFLLYPVTVSLLVMRYAVASCLGNE